MFKWILLLMISVPILEILLFIWLGTYIGGWSVIGLIVFTAFIGGTLARRQGLVTLKRAQLSMQNGQLPGNEIIDGICILIGAVLSLMPGFITDVIGLIMLIPFTRPLLINWLKAIMQNLIKSNSLIIYRRF